MSGLCTIRHGWLSRPQNLRARGPPERKDGGGRGRGEGGETKRKIERKLGGNWDGHRLVRTRKVSRKKCVFVREKHEHICIMWRSKRGK